MKTRRRFLQTALAATSAPGLAAPPQRPNFLFLFTDDQRFDTIRALGNREIQTPNLDRLVARGVAFTHACTQGGLNPAICMPSRAQVMTGLSLFRVEPGIVRRPASPDPSMRTFPERLRQAGYQTFGTGKWHNGPALYNRSFSHGANIFFGGMQDHLKTMVHDYASSGAYPKQAAKPAPSFSSQAFADASIRFLKERDRARPFLLYCAFTSPHDPRMAPREFEALYPPEKVALPANFLPQHPFDNGELKVRDELLAPFPRTPDQIRRHIAAYYAMISEVDHQIGRVIEALEASGDAANTYVIFAGDNGLAVGQHGLMGKQNLYDHSLRVPLVIGGPGVAKGRRADGLCHLMDLGPTICELAGAPIAETLDGRSLRPALANPKTPLRDAVVGAYRNFQRCLRTAEWKLILYNVGGSKTTQLFDLKKDPLERNNLAAAPGQARRLSELKALLQSRLKEAGDKTDLDAAEWPA